ncbi:MAG: carboxymuconolactone decarboxylase family protein [Stellaceae bacterium]
MRGPSPLTPGERELIAAYVSGVNSCRYCFGSRSSVAKGFGIPESVFAILMDDLDLAPIDARLKPLLRYVRKLTETPSRMTRADADAVYQAGWHDEALLHAVAVCAYCRRHGHCRERGRICKGRASVDRPRLRHVPRRCWPLGRENLFGFGNRTVRQSREIETWHIMGERDAILTLAP